MYKYIYIYLYIYNIYIYIYPGMDEFMAPDWLNDSRFSKGKQPFAGPLPSFEPDPLLILSRLWESRHQTQRSQWRTVGQWKSNGLWWRERKLTRTVQEDWSMLLYRSQHKYGFYMFLHGFTCFYMCLHVYMCFFVMCLHVLPPKSKGSSGCAREDSMFKQVLRLQMACFPFPSLKKVDSNLGIDQN